MGYNITNYLCIFFIYSFLGWFMESVGGYFKLKKFVNRGFLIGPYCPVYGIGVCMLTAFLGKYVDDIPIMFFMSMLICGALEYFTSYIMEKIFKARWWDYHNRKFNINGRICLETLIPFGIAGLVLVRYANSFFLNILSKVTILNWILGVICILFVVDLICSFNIILGFRKATKEVENHVKDNTEEIVEHVKEIAIDRIDNAKDELHKINQNLIVNYKVLKKNLRYTSQKIYASFIESTEKIRGKLTIQNYIKNSEKKIDLNKLVRERLSKKWTTRRLVKAFPSFEIKLKKDKNKDG